MNLPKIKIQVLLILILLFNIFKIMIVLINSNYYKKINRIFKQTYLINAIKIAIINFKIKFNSLLLIILYKIKKLIIMI
jgi:hypothetical protein